MITILDNLFTSEDLEKLRESAIQGGFGTWTPPTSLMGSGNYEGMAYKGDHLPLHKTLSFAMGRSVYPNLSFFRILTEATEKRYIHSDRNEGDYTCIVYLSDHKDISGTEFYRHKSTGRTEMPSIEEMKSSKELEVMSKDMTEDENAWERTDFCRGLYGRMLIFSAPLFHGRFPLHGIGTKPTDTRMIWVCHFGV